MSREKVLTIGENKQTNKFLAKTVNDFMNKKRSQTMA